MPEQEENKDERLKRVDIMGFTKGLVIKSSPEDLNPNQVQDAEDVEFTLEPGAAVTRRGVTRYSDEGYTGNVDIYYQNIFSTSGLIIRADTTLADGDTVVSYEVTDAQMDITEFDQWIIMANGSENLKYKASGMGLFWHGCYTYPWEKDFAAPGSLSRTTPFFRVDLDGIFYTTYSWVSHVLLGTVASMSAAYSPTDSLDDGYIDGSFFYNGTNYITIGSRLDYLKTSDGDFFKTVNDKFFAVQV